MRLIAGDSDGALATRVAEAGPGPDLHPRCRCTRGQHPPKLVVLTGGPGAGKTATLEMLRHHLCEHVAILPEAAGILFGGGFPRKESSAGHQAAQRAIFRVERELEWLALHEGSPAIVLCDRGTLDGSAYWPAEAEPFFEANGTSLEAEMRRYAAVIHLRTPLAAGGYNHRNPLRTETALEAAAIDRAIQEVWHGHPHRTVIDNAGSFVVKAMRAIAAVLQEVPECCRPDLAELGRWLEPSRKPCIQVQGARADLATVRRIPRELE